MKKLLILALCLVPCVASAETELESAWAVCRTKLVKIRATDKDSQFQLGWQQCEVIFEEWKKSEPARREAASLAKQEADRKKVETVAKGLGK